MQSTAQPCTPLRDAAQHKAAVLFRCCPSSKALQAWQLPEVHWCLQGPQTPLRPLGPLRQLGLWPPSPLGPLAQPSAPLALRSQHLPLQWCCRARHHRWWLSRHPLWHPGCWCPQAARPWLAALELLQTLPPRPQPQEVCPSTSHLERDVGQPATLQQVVPGTSAACPHAMLVVSQASCNWHSWLGMHVCLHDRVTWCLQAQTLPTLT